MPAERDITPGSDQMREIVSWLVDAGFPFDYSTTHPAPGLLLEPVAAEWARRDNETLENYLWSCQQEQTWTP